METITPNLSQVMGENDSESIRNAILLAKRRGVNSITIPRLNQRTGKPLWSIGSAIVVPSEMEIVLDNCHLRQEDGCYDNMFRTFLDTSLEGHTVAERRHSIVIAAGEMPFWTAEYITV